MNCASERANLGALLGRFGWRAVQPKVCFGWRKWGPLYRRANLSKIKLTPLYNLSPAEATAQSLLPASMESVAKSSSPRVGSGIDGGIFGRTVALAVEPSCLRLRQHPYRRWRRCARQGFANGAKAALRQTWGSCRKCRRDHRLGQGANPLGAAWAARETLRIVAPWRLFSAPASGIFQSSAHAHPFIPPSSACLRTSPPKEFS